MVKFAVMVIEGCEEREFSRGIYNFWLQILPFIMWSVSQAPMSGDTTKLVGYGNRVSNSQSSTECDHGGQSRRDDGSPLRFDQGASKRLKSKQHRHMKPLLHTSDPHQQKNHKALKPRNQWGDYVSKNQRHPDSITHCGVDQVCQSDQWPLPSDCVWSLPIGSPFLTNFDHLLLHVINKL